MEEINRLKAISNILICPKCRKKLKLLHSKYECSGCAESYNIVEGIPLLYLDKRTEAKEVSVRDKVAEDALLYDENTIMDIVKKFHYISLMRKRIEAFFDKVAQDGRILDIGVGWGWHWSHTQTKQTIVGIDLSIKSLLIAKRLLKNNKNVFLICADACALPFEQNSFNAFWSVQTLQHLLPDLFDKAVNEVDRVLKKRGYFEIRWLNDNYLLKLAYLLSCKKYQKEQYNDQYYLRRHSGKDLLSLFGKYKKFNGLQVAYDECLFHPWLKPIYKSTHDSRSLTKIDKLISSIPILNRLIANQSIICGRKY